MTITKRIQFEAIPSKEGKKERLDFLKEKEGVEMPMLAGRRTVNQPAAFKGNIENFIGITQLPTGLVGPLKINGDHAKGEFFIPLATTEGALVASYSRGIKAITKSGGATVLIEKEGLQRCPAFKFSNMKEGRLFLQFMEKNKTILHQIVAKNSNYAKLKSIESQLMGNLVLLTFSYETGDAAGQNMVTICTDAICKYLNQFAPIAPQKWYIESNMSGDKKANAANFSSVRGKRLVADVTIPRKTVLRVLKTTPETMEAYLKNATLATMQAGARGTQGHFANGLAALFLATGNDAACVAEAAAGFTIIEVTPTGDLYAAIVLPSFVAGTVGGGTGLPTQKECLNLMGCAGAGNSRKYAEIAAGLLLGGELSIVAALAEGHFTQAHAKLGR